MRQLKITPRITKHTGLIDRYLNDIEKIDRISAQREVELAQLIKKGDMSAREELITANLRFVVSVAKQYEGEGLDLSDLINEGNEGLIEAAMRFDETRGFKFISFAVWWIRQSILLYIKSQSTTIRIPLSAYAERNKAIKYMESESVNHNRHLTLTQAAIESGLNPVYMEHVENCSSCLKLDAPISDGENATLMDLLRSDNIDDIDSSTTNKRIKALLFELLDKRSAQVLISTFNLDGRGLTAEQVADEQNLTGERIRQIKFHALEKIRDKAAKSGRVKQALMELV